MHIQYETIYLKDLSFLICCIRMPSHFRPGPILKSRPPPPPPPHTHTHTLSYLEKNVKFLKTYYIHRGFFIIVINMRLAMKGFSKKRIVFLQKYTHTPNYRHAPIYVSDTIFPCNVSMIPWIFDSRSVQVLTSTPKLCFEQLTIVVLRHLEPF